MQATIIQFPTARGQMRKLREQMRNEDETASQSAQAAISRDELSARHQRAFARIAVSLMDELKPLLWQWVGAVLTMTFKVEPDLFAELANDPEKTKQIFSAIHAVSGEYFWTIMGIRELSFDESIHVLVVKADIAECASSATDDDHWKEEDYWEYLRHGENDQNFEWEYIFKMR